MDEKPDQIAQHIEWKRGELGRNLDELQDKVRETTDWRKQFERHPYVLMSAALGGGILLSSVVGSGLPRSRGYYAPTTPDTEPAASPSLDERPMFQRKRYEPSYQRQQAYGTLETIKTALFGLAASRAQDFLNEMLPGFREHFQEAQNKAPHPPDSSRHQQQNWAPQQQPWGERHDAGQSFNQPERWSGQPGEQFHSGQWPQERNWERERDRERQYTGGFEGQGGSFRR